MRPAIIRKEAFGVNRMTRKKLRRCKRRIQDRLRHRQRKGKPTPVLQGGNVRYKVADRVGRSAWAGSR